MSQLNLVLDLIIKKIPIESPFSGHLVFLENRIGIPLLFHVVARFVEIASHKIKKPHDFYKIYGLLLSLSIGFEMEPYVYLTFFLVVCEM